MIPFIWISMANALYLALKDNWQKNTELLDSKICKRQSERRQALENILNLRQEQICTLVIAASLISTNRLCWEHQRSKTYWEVDCQSLSDERFKNTFRMSRLHFGKLCIVLKCLEKENTIMRSSISLPKRIAVALYALGSSAEYRTIASLFGIGKSTVCEIVLEFCDACWDQLRPQYLNAFPLTRTAIQEYVKGFEKLGFPQCLGAIDGCHIEVHPRAEDTVDYYNYKGWYSTILLALVDARYRFMYINVGAPGKCSDSTIFESSSLKQELLRCNLLQEMSKTINSVEVPVLILGDSAFKFSTNLMKPYPFSMEKDRQQKCFNYALSKCRRVVENAFGHLKARFRCIGKGIDNKVENAPKIIKTCCVLHNFLNDNNDHINESWLQSQRLFDDGRVQREDSAMINDHLVPPERIRSALALQLSSLGEDVLEHVAAEQDGPASSVVVSISGETVSETAGEIDSNKLTSMTSTSSS